MIVQNISMGTWMKGTNNDIIDMVIFQYKL